MLINVVQIISIWAIPAIIGSVLLIALCNNVKVYESFVEGATEGAYTAIKIMPFLLAMMVSIQVFRASGAMNEILLLGKPIFDFLGIPSDLIPLAIMRPLSGSGTIGLGVDIINFFGVDSLYGKIAATIMASSDTTFYILTVYFGSVGISKVRYSILTGLIADVTAFLSAIYLGYLLFGI